MSRLQGTWMVYALLLVSSLVSSAFVPVAPTFARELSLSSVQVGAALAAATVPLLLVAGHLGALGDRVPGRTLTVAASGVLCVASVAHAFAFDFVSLLAVRLMFGLGQAILWTAGLAWLATLKDPGRQSRALSGTIFAAGVGVAAGPAYGGMLADAFSVGTPFVLGGAVLLAVTVGLIRTSDTATAAVAADAVPLRTTLRLVRGHRALLGASVALVLSGMTAGVVNLLVPLQLEANGLTAGSVGGILTLSTALFAVGAGVITRFGDRAASLRANGAAALFLAATVMCVVVSSSTLVTIAFLLLRVPGWAVLSTAPYALIAVFAGRGDLGYGAVIGIATQFWAAASSLSSIAAGAVLAPLGTDWTYLSIAVVTLIAGAWLLAQPSAAKLVILNRQEGT